MSVVAVIDYGMSNLRSVAKALEHVAEGKHRVRVCNTPEEVLQADRVVFPGQGAIGDCMENLRRLGLDHTIRETIANKPFLGICLGLQSLMHHSDEDGGTKGLEVHAGGVKRFPTDALDPRTKDRLKVPHMGWNQVKHTRPHPLWAGIDSAERFYFVHSYYVQPDDSTVIAAETDYAVSFTSALARDNVFATQFHPEKSQRPGLQLLSNFLDWDGTNGA